MKRLLFILLLPVSAIAQDQTVSMKDYVDRQVELLIKMSDIRYSNIEHNVATANAAMEKRLDGMNEFRDALKDSNKTYVTRTELILAVSTLLGLFWGYSRHQREKLESERKSSGQNIKSGDTVEVKK